MMPSIANKRAIVLGNRVTSTPGVCGGQPCIAGHRVRILDIYVMHRLEQGTMETILAAYPTLCKDDVEAGIAYYQHHLQEVEQSYREEDQLVAGYRQQMGARAL